MTAKWKRTNDNKTELNILGLNWKKRTATRRKETKRKKKNEIDVRKLKREKDGKKEKEEKDENNYVGKMGREKAVTISIMKNYEDEIFVK